MHKKDIAELRRAMGKQPSPIVTIAGRYVDSTRKIVSRVISEAARMSDDVLDQYCAILKKGLSGSLGKTLHSLEFPTEQEMHGDQYKLLSDLRKSGLNDEALIDEYCQSIADNFAYGEEYYILIVHGMYDVPYKAKDGYEDDEFPGDEVYDFLYTVLCPVVPSESGLCYDAQSQLILERSPALWIKAPVVSILFPAFSNRTTDVHSSLYYTKKSDEMYKELIEKVLGTPAPLSYADQKEAFQGIVGELSGGVCDYDTALAIQDTISEKMHEHEQGEDGEEPLIFQQRELRDILENSGMDEERIRDFDQVYEEKTEGNEEGLAAENLVSPKRTQVRMSGVEVSVVEERSYLLKPQLVDGRRCIVIPLEGDIEVDGMPVSSGKRY